jgi:predicted small secreted protein
MAGRGYRRLLVALAAAAVLLTGCGTGGAGEDAALSRKQVRAAVPDPAAMPGWEEKWEPQVVGADHPHVESLCELDDPGGCAGARFQGSSRFSLKGAGLVTFLLVAYDDGKHAKSAYAPLWSRHGTDGRKLREPDVAGIADQSDGAVVRRVDPKGEEAVVQLRAGTTMLTVTVEGLHEGKLDDTRIRALAEMFAERAQQAQSGADPSATLPG